MQATLGRKGDYSVRAVLELARHGQNERRKTRQIAAAMDIPERFLTQILAQLVRTGLLTAVAGPEGGYVLARAAADISLLDVVEAAEGPVSLEQCVLRGGTCDWIDACPIHISWSRAQFALKEELRATSFADLAEIDAEIAAGTYASPADAPPHGTPTTRKGQRVEE